MNQQINLFQPIFRRESKHLSFDTLIKFAVIMIVGLAIIYGANSYSVLSLNKDVSNLKQQHTQRLTQLTTIKMEAERRHSANSTEDEIAQLQAELVAERYILSLLKRGKIKQSHGFSKYLESLSQKIVKGMWITGFEVSRGGADLRINGGAIAAKLIPEFLAGLSQEPLLRGKAFNVLKIEREQPNRRWIEFRIAADEIGQDEQQ